MDLYIRLPVCSALYARNARNAQYARGPSSLHYPPATAISMGLMLINLSDHYNFIHSTYYLMYYIISPAVFI